ncbi:MAG: hypothetical protein EBZ48_13800 [Proteobacteria bacterium]|nr:hypothetical protein [Pseudomonadota bacterium]
MLAAAMIGCGRYMRPIPPEFVSADAAQEVKVQGTVGGVRLSWSSPVKDRRGKELKELDGYRIERKSLVKNGDTVSGRVRFQQLSFVQDGSVKELQKQKELLRSQDKPSHRAKIDPALQQFEFIDTTVKPGEQYLYRIVPRSYYGDGAVRVVARVLFRGDSSEVSMLTGLTSDGDVPESVFGTEDDE